MKESLTKIAIDGFSDHCGVEVVRYRHSSTIVKEEKGVKHNVKGINGKLVFSFHPIHKF